jgi:hypothetical protein
VRLLKDPEVRVRVSQRAQFPLTTTSGITNEWRPCVLRNSSNLISERTKAGLASARARGRRGGAPFKMTAAKVRLAMAAMGQKDQMGRCARMG